MFINTALMVLTLSVAQPSAPALDDVVVTGSVSDARELLSRGADVNARDREGVTPLMRAASAGRGDMVRLLLAGGADVNAKTTGGVTALMMASLGGYADAVAPLLAAKADINAKDSQGRTALMAASSSGDRATIQALLDAGGDVKADDATGGTPITYAAAEGHTAAVAMLQKQGGKAGDLELILAAGRCNTDIVRMFLDSGMRVDTPDSGTTPLIVAAGDNCGEVVGLLIDRGANVDAKNADRQTPLIKAAAAGHVEIVRTLLGHGADMTAADASGRTAWTYAAMANQLEIADMFRRARASQPPKPIQVASPSLRANEPMPREFTADGHNVSPALAWSTVPDGTRSIAVLCEDPDAGDPPPFVHWVIYNIPGTASGLPENIPSSGPMPADVAGAVQGVSGYRQPFYRGPAPPPGKVHRYHFVVYALDVDDLAPGLARADLLEAIKGHILGRGELVTTYERIP